MDKKNRPFIQAARRHGARIETSGAHIKVYYGKELIAQFSQTSHGRSVGAGDNAGVRKKWKELGWL